MGLLDVLDIIKKEGSKYLKDAMPGGLLNPEIEQHANETAQAIRNKGKAFERAIADPNQAGDAYKVAMDMVGMAPLGLTVWHGSPHKFDKFDMSKIGNGEGAQAYGHGLYFAESPEVATGYKESLSGGSQKVLNASFSKDPELWAASQVYSKIPDEDIIAGLNSLGYKGNPKELVNSAKTRLTNELSNYGQLYKVDIPDEAVASFLDWDKKLSEQIPEVQEVAKQWNNGTLPTGIQSGDELLRYIQQQLRFIGSPKKAEQVLNEAGIPGIRYLDGGSRSAGQGSSNFVLFDDQLPRILETNGVPTGLQPWKPGEWQGLLR